MTRYPINHRPSRFRDIPTTYIQLVAWYPPRPIRSQADLDRATQVIDTLAGRNLNADQEGYLDLVSTLVAHYEDDAVLPRKLPPLTALRFLMTENAMNASDLSRLLGNRELGSKILRGQRRLSLNHIATLAAHFAVSPALFMPPPRRKGHSHDAPRAASPWRTRKQTPS